MEKKLIEVNYTLNDVGEIFGSILYIAIADASSEAGEVYELYGRRGEVITNDNRVGEIELYRMFCNTNDPLGQFFALLYLSQYDLIHKDAYERIEKVIMREPFNILMAYKVSKIAARTKADSWLVKLFKDGGTAKLFSLFSNGNSKQKTEILDFIGNIFVTDKNYQEKIRAEEILIEVMHSDKEQDEVKAMAYAYFLETPPFILDNRSIIGMYGVMYPNVSEKASKLLKKKEERIQKEQEELEKQKKRGDELIKKIKDEKRIHIEVNGKSLRLLETAQQHPEILIKILCGDINYKSNRPVEQSAILSTFAKLGKKKDDIVATILKNPQWGLGHADIEYWYPHYQKK